MMLSIYICDDIEKQAILIKDEINNYLIFQDWDIKPAAYATSPHDLFEMIAGDENTGLYFLDIDLKADIDGFEVAKRLRKKDPRCFIIFLTSHEELAPLAFKCRIEAMDYIVKNDSHIAMRVRHCLDEAYHRYRLFSKEDENHLCIRKEYKDIYIEKKNIISITSSTIPHQIVICTKDEELTLYGELKV